MECLIASSKAPSVVSPPWICAIGNFMILQLAAADKSSYLSPSTTIKSNVISSNALANSSIPFAVDMLVPNGESSFKSRLINETKIFAGKTGTSQIRQISEQERKKGIIKNQDLPRNQRDHALFTGYAPFTNPKFSVSIVVEHGGGGGKVAAPIARDILIYALNGALPSLQEYPAEERNKMNSIINNIKREMISI